MTYKHWTSQGHVRLFGSREIIGSYIRHRHTLTEKRVLRQANMKKRSYYRHLKIAKVLKIKKIPSEFPENVGEI